MELRELAERVLFATTLEEKIQCPAVVTDERPGTALAAPPTPGRPPELLFKSQSSSQGEFPALHQLENERERGRLLHFFANHELLATELMALVLLRFPDAPAAFRRGVLQTMRDEQEHTRLYLARMQSCGIAFGELPVSGYFWRAVSGMASPMDYVAGLSLTFEQANLDFARHFASRFTAVGDATTAQLLDRIYHDEIAHVAYGLKWFRRWKNPRLSDWEAFCQQLQFPLSPQRAKGIALNVEGRRAAGFDPTFVAELDVFAQSKGRTPSVLVFNPFTEARIAQGKAFTPVKHQAQLARDLENLPLFLGRQDDIVLTEQRPSVEFLSSIKRAGFSLPEFVEMGGINLDEPADRAEIQRRALRSLSHRKLGRLRPWAWGPDSVELLAPLFANLTGEARTPETSFNQTIAPLYSKAWSADFLRRWLTDGGSGLSMGLDNSTARPASTAPQPPWLCTLNEVGTTVSTLDLALAAIAAIRARGHHRVVVKQAFGLAGHNALRLWEPDLLEKQRRWMERSLQGGRQLVIEPWLERVVDFSVQLEMGKDGLQLVGYTGLQTDAKGQFLANTAAPQRVRALPSAVLKCFRDHPRSPALLHQLYAELTARLGAELKSTGYYGPVGIDAFVYRDHEGNARLKPVVEINPRYTMGRLTLELMKRTAPGAHGTFRLVNAANLRAEGFASFSSYARHLLKQFPPSMEGDPVPRIRSGAFCLNDPNQVQVVLAVLQVGTDAKHC